jgi:hypothetical protein
MLKLDNEGIKKLTELFGDNVTEVVDRINAVAQAGKDYSTFTEAMDGQGSDGSADDTVNDVRFIYKTGAITSSDSGD